MIRLLSLFSLAFVCLSDNMSFSHRLDKLEGALCTCSDFIEEDRRRVEATIPANKEESLVLQSRREGLENLQRWVDSTFARIEDVKNQRDTLDSFLCEQVRQRLQYLQSRTDDIIANLESPEHGRTSVKIISTDPDLFQRHFSAKSRELNEATLKVVMQEWEYKQLLIKHTFHALEAEGGMSAHTRAMLQLSPSLWPLLQHQTYDLGHPDQVGGYGSFLWIMDRDPRLKEAGAANVYRMSVIGDQKEFVAPLDRVYAKEVLPRLDGELYRAYTDRSIQTTFPDLMLGGKGRTFTVILTPLEAGIWGDPLKRPDFLFNVKKEKESENIPTVIPVPYMANKTSSSFPAKIIKEESLPPAPSERANVPPVAPLNPPISLASEEPSQHLASREQEEANEPAMPPLEQPRIVLDAAPLLQTMPQKEEFVWPRGIRLSRPDVLEKLITPVINPDKKVQRFVNDLFDKRNLSRISFPDFQNHWERIGGRVEGTRGGGSHRHLIAPDGTSLWGTFDHGGFGSQTIGYLQAAFWSQGYRPEK